MLSQLEVQSEDEYLLGSFGINVEEGAEVNKNFLSASGP
jgi:hypothetical protein